MTKTISFRVTEDEFELFCQSAKDVNRTLSSYMKNLARQDAYKTGARTSPAAAKLNPGSTTTTITAMQSKPSPSPKINPDLAALFEDDESSAHSLKQIPNPYAHLPSVDDLL
jgi:uncharacterized protein (DUF1778 family)